MELTNLKLVTWGYYRIFTKDPHQAQVKAMINRLLAQTEVSRFKASQ